VTTGGVVGISTTSAILNATAIGNNLLTNVTFTYGLQPDLSGATMTVDAGQVTGAAPTAVEVAVVDLVPGTTYYFRANATNAAGTVSGAISSFTTLGGVPIVITGDASAIASDTATLSGTVNANSVATQAFFQYSRIADFSVFDGGVIAGDVNGTESAVLTAPIAGLEPNTIYFWRLVATNASGTVIGEAKSFSTPVFGRPTSLAAPALLRALSIERDSVTKTVVTPTAKSRAHCAVNSRTNRLTFGKPGVCRVRIVITRNGEVSRSVFNLVVK
jgi:hypothetical protein